MVILRGKNFLDTIDIFKIIQNDTLSYGNHMSSHMIFTSSFNRAHLMVSTKSIHTIIIFLFRQIIVL